MSILRVERLSKSYPSRHGKREILNDISFEVSAGERLGVLGRNGAGKSTLVRLISGIEFPTLGHIRRMGRISWPLAFTGCFQGSLTGLDNTRFVARIYGEDEQRVRAYVEDFAELGSFYTEPVKTYSSGMQARLAFALSLAVDFDCYLIDEIIAVGDASFQKKCLQALADRQERCAYIIVSHNADLIQSQCTRAAVINHEGSLLNFDSLDDAYLHYNQLMESA